MHYQRLATISHIFLLLSTVSALYISGAAFYIKVIPLNDEELFSLLCVWNYIAFFSRAHYCEVVEEELCLS